LARPLAAAALMPRPLVLGHGPRAWLRHALVGRCAALLERLLEPLRQRRSGLRLRGGSLFALGHDDILRPPGSGSG
jgi:hypothetical protein